MADYSGRARAYRTRATKEEAPKDTITSVLTAQVILCIILAVCMLFIKKFDHEDYMEIKREYGVMLSDSEQGAELAKKISEKNVGFARFFSEIDRLLNELRPKSADEAASEPESEPENEPINDSKSEALQRDFDYLKEDAAVTETMLVNEKSSYKTLSAPAYSALSPIYLSESMTPPLTGIITSGFSYREHPLTGNSDFHTGIDIAAGEGASILAALPGEVTEVGDSEIYGNYIVLQHANNLKTSYSHCSEIIASEGMVVRQGEQIALVGETGKVTGPHLHFSVMVDDDFADPALILGDYIQLTEK